ncbi:NAD(P)(+) transhydrogenase (Re/Si-specific) subunit beta [Foetidibacter luteolus]|uniref:NAD(P)(+) transhydrogenase (Re/Si-specific) subunit beta n=1 Tax=Foetidibacter luteolus TaxID=2608880 RepID=UPI00129B9D07|nr:NAD(P)(+) transhydrogenase (Re/Si-specific) subunit beta [Foetidibacter luteolus]
MQSEILAIIYLLASVTFIVGLKMLSSPATARKGNLIAAGGMVTAIAGTIFLYRDEEGNALHNYGWIFGGLLIGSVIGVLAAKKVKMTAMPEMVSLFNGMGGACAALISISEYLDWHLVAQFALIDESWQSVVVSHRATLLVIILGCFIGSVSFAGSVVAWGKLKSKIKDYSFKGQHFLNLGVLLIIMVASLLFVFIMPLNAYLFLLIFVAALIYGILFVLPIGGADMPVVISLLNSFTGVAAACGGFLYNNKVMLTGGILVGAAGTLLTILMCRAMNRSLRNVLIGSFGGTASAAGGQQQAGGSYKEINITDAAMVMGYAHKIIVVPGYGLAVAQAQHVCQELEELLEEKGVEVKYAIHPVAGRMPGHMNVLLAEADVPYDKLLEMEQANEEFKSADVVLVLGANDVVNPAAKHDKTSPIYGMPILEVEDAKLVIVNKRSMKPGYAGIENELFFKPKTSMLFGDAKGVLQKLVTEVKSL